MKDIANLKYPFSLPALAFAPDALEPHIDARTMEIHHGKHHAAYVNNLNAALEKHPDLDSATLERPAGRTWPPCRRTSAPRCATTAAVTPTTPCSGSS